MRIRLVLADDHTLVRTGIRSLLERISGIEVVGEADDGADALELVERLKPDVLLADISMREVTGLDAAAVLAARHPQIKTIILSMHRNEEYVAQALRAGCAGYLLKDAAAIELDLAIDAVARGEIYLSPAVSRAVVDKFVALKTDRDADVLTPRQRQVLKLIAEGQSTKQIAQTLEVSAKTVETHRAKVMERLGIHDVAGLVKYAIRTGVITPEV